VQRRDGRLLAGLAGEEVRGCPGQDEADGQVLVLGEAVDDLDELDGCDGARGGEEEVEFLIVAGELHGSGGGSDEMLVMRIWARLN